MLLRKTRIINLYEHLISVVKLSQLLPQLGLYADPLREESLEYQLQNDTEILKDLPIDEFCGYLGRKETAGQLIFSKIRLLMKSFLGAPFSNA